jgi:hypothetical protein
VIPIAGRSAEFTMSLPLSFRLLLSLVLLPSLAACVSDKTAFAPACPQPEFVKPLADLVRVRSGGGQDVTDQVLQARMLRVDGKCQMAGDQTQLQTTLTVAVDVQRGLAMQGREAEVPIFVAVTDGDTIRDKHIYTLRVAFPSNVDRMTATSPTIDMTLPVSATKSGAAYGIIAGFQLKPDELAANRQRAAH